jgi:uncharacterized protein
MHIQRETLENNTIRSYTDHEITVGSERYESSVIISADAVIPSWPIQHLQELNETTLEPILALRPEIIMIGHSKTATIPLPVLEYLSKQRIGIESMSIGSASRTFNVLLSEKRRVVVGIIISAGEPQEY